MILGHAAFELQVNQILDLALRDGIISSRQHYDLGVQMQFTLPHQQNRFAIQF